MKTKKIISLVFALCLSFSAAACSGGQNNSGVDGGGATYTLPDYDLKKDELSVDIAGWVMPAEFNDVQVGYLKESGISTLQLARSGKCAYNFTLSGKISDKDTAFLELCEKNGFKAYPHVEGKVAESILQVESLNPYAAAYGVIFDEPNRTQIDQIASYVSAFNAKSQGKELFVNLYPSFAPTVKTEFESYIDYLEYYCKNVLEKLTEGQKWLSADRYPLTYDTKGQPCLDPGWLSDVQAVALTANSYDDVKTNFFIQTMPYGGESKSGAVIDSRDRIPTYEDVRLQEYTLMAFGYDMISCFCYGSPAVGVEFLERQTAMLDREGNKTEIFNAVKKANNEILAFDHVIKQFDWQGVFTCDAGVTETEKGRTSNTSFKALQGRMSVAEIDNLKSVTASADTLFGYFIDNEDNAGFMVVNYNESTLKLTDNVTLTFDSSYKYTKALCYIGGNKQTLDIKNNALNLTLGAGEGVFVIPY